VPSFILATITAHVTGLLLPQRRTSAQDSQIIFLRVAAETRKVRNFAALAQ
jgi:hypothetical protein